LLWLDEIGEADRPAVGAKAFTLARLRREGFPVPDGFVVTAEGRPPADAIRAAWARLGAPAAVRSSSTAEDSRDASFAGQHRTVLDVRTAEQLEEALALCLRSAAAATPYAGAMGAAPGLMAVLVQRLVEPRVAGVAFTRHPADPSRLLVEAHRGRGEALVSGAVTPERYVVDRDTGSLHDGPGDASLDGAALAAVVALASRIEAVLGAPQDVEWALGADGMALLQSRPITVEDEDVPDPRIRRLTRANVGEVLPDPVTPLTWTTVGSFLEHAFREVAARAGLLLPGDSLPFLVLHRRRLYLNLDACLEVAARVPGLAAADAERLLLGGGARGHASLPLTVSSVARFARVAWCLLRLRARLPLEIVDAERRVRSLTPRTEIERADRSRLRSLLLRFMEVGRAVAVTHVATSGASGLRLALLARVLSRRPGDPVDRVNRLVGALDDVESAAPALALAALAGQARGEPQWLEWLRRARRGGPATTSDAPPALRRALGVFLESFGHRAFSEGELSAPAWEDDPGPILDALRTLASASHPPGLSRRAAAALREADEEALLSRLGPLRRALARRVLAGARAGVRQREHTKSLAVALVRHGRLLARAGGRLLAATGALPREEDVFFLRWGELLRALEDGRPVAAPLLRRRRKRHEGEGALPAPREVDLAGKDVRAGEDGPGLRGIGVSPGVGLGPARVLRPGEVPRLEPGEVLVTPVLDAGFAPLLVSAAGAVAEIGGLLSHGAVVARELGVPCVVDVRDATRRIGPGARVLVDGRRGEVRLLATEAQGTGATVTPLLEWEDPGSERLFPLEPHPLARESVYFNVHDPAAGLVIVAALGVRRRGRGESLLALGLPDGRALFGLDLAPAATGGSGLAVAGARTAWNPARLQVETRLACFEEGALPPGPLPLLLAPRTVPVSIDLAFVPTTPPIDFGRQLSEAEREALRPLGSYHVEQSGAWRGEVVVDGRRIALAGTGSRDHSRGRRDWEAADHWRLFTARLGDDLAVHALAVSVRGTLVEGGFLWREGRAERITRVLHAAVREGGRVRSLDLEVATAAGPALRLSGRVERTITVPVRVERRPGRHLAGRPYRLLLHENFTRYEGGGRVGHGIAEITERPL
jgi:pyruvate,water dikinase